MRLVLQGDLTTAGERRQLWEKGRHKNAYIVGFLQGLPDDLPEEHPAHAQRESLQQQLAPLLADGNPFAWQYLRLLSHAGQNFLAGVETVLAKPANQDVMVELMHAVAAYSAQLPLQKQRLETIAGIEQEVDRLLSGQVREVDEMLRVAPAAVHDIRALLFLAMLDEPVLDPVFSRTDAIGTVMRNKLRPLTGPIQQRIAVLRGRS